MTNCERGLQALSDIKKDMYNYGLHNERPDWLDGLPENPTKEGIQNIAAEKAEKLTISVCPNPPQAVLDILTGFAVCGINAWLRGCADRRE